VDNGYSKTKEKAFTNDAPFVKAFFLSKNGTISVSQIFFRDNGADL